MPLIKSAIKRVKISAKKQKINYRRRDRVKTAVRTVLDLAKAGKLAEAKKALQAAYKEIDLAAGHYILHRNTAARRKSRVARAVATMKKK